MEKSVRNPMFIRIAPLVTFLFSLLIISTISAQQSTLELQDIMAGDKWIGHQPSSPWWSDNSEEIYFYWNPVNAPSDSLYSYNLTKGDIGRVNYSREQDITPQQGSYNNSKTLKVFTRNGDLFLRDVATNENRKITNTLQNISSPEFTSDDRGIVYRISNNLFLLDLTNGVTLQLTDFRSGSESGEQEQNNQEEWLENQQLQLFEVLRERDELQEITNEMREKEQPERPLTIWLGNKSLASITIDPGQRFVTYLVQSPANQTRARIPRHVNTSGYTDDFPTNPKVGSSQRVVSLGIYDMEKRTSYMVSTENIPGIKDVPEYMREYGFKEEQFENGRDVDFTGITWSPDGAHLAVNIRSHDNKDRWIMLLDPETAELTLVDRQRDEAWIAGPGIDFWQGGSSMGWMPDNSRLWFQSEESGYSHLYTVDVITGEKRALTSGNFEIYDPFISDDEQNWYFTSNELHPGERHFYRMPLEGGRRTRITSMEGRSDVTISPDGEKLAVLYSSYNEPWELYLMDNMTGANAEKITNSLSDDFMEYEWRVPELISFNASDGAEVLARLYRPDDPVEGGPAIIFVHGAGYLQNAHKWWSSYYREYMFHNLLTDLGYTVMDIDFRASSGYGRDWRTGIYRHMGGKDLSDNVDGARFLIENYDIDPGRIGIYGGSYGGFITLMAMFNHPDLFAAGAALRSVTDWAHYNHGYTSNILNTPVTDSIAFVRSSPIYFAEGLEGALLMCHGMIDDNVHFQDIVRLTQRLIELGKENWELAVYPVERHGFTETSSWVDEYRRILKLFEDNLK